MYGPARTFERLERAYGDHERGSLAKSYDVRSWVEGEPVADRAVHGHPAPGRAPGRGVRAAGGVRGAVLAYSGDTDSCQALVELSRDADVLLAEASFVEGRDAVRGVHLTGRRAGQAADAAGVRRLVLTHQPIWTDPQVTSAEAREVYSGPVDVARPGLTLTLSATPHDA